MDQHRRGRNIKTLWALVLLGVTYSGLFYYRYTLTGANNVDGIIGVVFGLYICSHPAANAVDMLFFGRGARRWFSSRRSVILWLALNMLVLLVGWIVIFVGTTRLIARTEAVSLSVCVRHEAAQEMRESPSVSTCRNGLLVG